MCIPHRGIFIQYLKIRAGRTCGEGDLGGGNVSGRSVSSRAWECFYKRGGAGGGVFEMDHVAGVGDDAGSGMEFAEFLIALADEDAGVRCVVRGLAAEAVVEERGGELGDVLFFATGKIGLVGGEERLGVPAGEEFVEREGEEKSGPFSVMREAVLFFGFGCEAGMGGEEGEGGDFAGVFKGIAEREPAAERIADEMKELERDVKGFREGRAAVAGKVEADAGRRGEVGAKRFPVEAGAEEAMEEDDRDAGPCFQISARKHEASRSFWNWWFWARSVKSSMRQVLEGREESESVG